MLKSSLNLVSILQKKILWPYHCPFRNLNFFTGNRLKETNRNLLQIEQPPHYETIRHVKRGIDFRPNTYKRIKKHGRQKRMLTIDGRIVIIRRMMKGISLRKLTH